ncbi:MAG: hypothetical protein GY952_10120 [Rhodobacteraceae bacterium]|nr:hypothetical protein [Paracoccaceae bacterium]
MALACGSALPATAQKFVDAAQIKPILGATKGNWIAVREYNGQDLLYFTHLLSWRCGLSEIHYSINSDAADMQWPLGTCDENSANPNALGDDQVIYGTYELQSINSVTVRVIYDDGSTDIATFDRASVQIN